MADIIQGIDIVISKKYRITSDTRQYILHERVTDKSENTFYYNSIGSVVESFIKRNVNNKNIRTLKELQDSIDKYGKICEDVFKNYKG